MRDLNKNFHLCISALGEWTWGAAQKEERFLQNCQTNFYRVPANFPPFAQFLTHLELLWAVLSLLHLIWALTHIRNHCKEMQAPLFSKKEVQIKQEHLKLKRKFLKAEVMHRLGKWTARAWVMGQCLSCAPELCCQNAGSETAQPGKQVSQHCSGNQIHVAVMSLMLSYRNLFETPDSCCTTTKANSYFSMAHFSLYRS